ncbi:hypothetical protein JMUB7533_26060 [Staphylococcus aureus]
MFNAVVVRKSASNVSYKVEKVDESHLSKGDVLVKVVYSSINYKDMLALQYKGGVIRDYPMTVSYTHLRAHETCADLVCRLLLEKKK